MKLKVFPLTVLSVLALIVAAAAATYFGFDAQKKVAERLPVSNQRTAKITTSPYALEGDIPPPNALAATPKYPSDAKGNNAR